jgi:hypothetical protein
MNRRRTGLLLAIAAITALSAVMAQAAQASFDTLKTFPTVEHAFAKAEADPTEPIQEFITVTGGFSIKCNRYTTTATVSDKGTEIAGEPAFSECVSSLGNAVTVKFNGCRYQLTSETDAAEHAAKTILCPAGKEIEIEAVSGCVVFVGPQVEQGVHYTNVQTGVAEREMHLTVSITAEDSIHWHTNKAFACSLAGIAESGEAGTYKGKWTVKGVEDNAGVEGVGQIGLTTESLSSSTMP